VFNRILIALTVLSDLSQVESSFGARSYRENAYLSYTLFGSVIAMLELSCSYSSLLIHRTLHTTDASILRAQQIALHHPLHNTDERRRHHSANKHGQEIPVFGRAQDFASVRNGGKRGCGACLFCFKYVNDVFFSSCLRLSILILILSSSLPLSI
jgi:hypothetical protein